MRIWKPLALFVLLGLSFAGTAHAWGVKFASGPDPAVSAWPAWPDPTSCDGVAFDPVVAFGGTTEAEKGTGAPEAALRKYLDARLYSQVPTRFWRLVAATETRAYFASGRLELGLFWLTAELVGSEWAIVGDPDECKARTVRDGIPATRWDLPQNRVPKPNAKVIRVKLTGSGGCDGGRSLNAAAEPEFRKVGRRLVLTIWIEPLPPGNYTCEHRIEPPLAVKLPGRLGKLSPQIWDGSSYPPRREF